MPAPEPSMAAKAALRLALQEQSSGGDKAKAKALSLALSPVDFEEAGDYQAELYAQLKHKYLLLRQAPPPPPSPTTTTSSDADSASVKGEHEALPAPKKVLFPLSSVTHGWRHGWQVGSGMQNFGNTCYLNSTLQALFHVSAFVNWLGSENHADKCSQNGVCIICAMRKTLMDTQTSGGPIRPYQVYSNLRSICRHLTPGRQEDAHEFLRYLVEAMEKAFLSKYEGSITHLDQYSKETTPLNQILGGYLRSVVRCLSCGRVSTTFQHFQDLLVDARKASTIDEALETFFSRERLEDLGYKCEFCNKKVSATKQFYLERPPMVLCIALKRFSLVGGKLTKHVQFRPKLSLNKYMSNQNNYSSLTYRLASIVTHLGQSQNCGHYTATGMGPSGSFYQFDDSCVREIPMPQVLNTNAYILFYELGTSYGSSVTNKNGVQCTQLSSSILKDSKEATASNFIGPIMPKSVEDDLKKSTPPSEISENEKQYLNGTKSKTSFLSLSSVYPSFQENGSTEPKEKTNGLSSYSSLNSQNSNGIKNSNTYSSPLFHSSNSPSSSNNNNSATVNSKVTHEGSTSFSEKSDKRHSNGVLSNGHKTNGEQKPTLFKVTILNKVCETKSSENKTFNMQKPQSQNEITHKVKLKNSISNGSSSSISPLVPYDCESSGENQDEYEPSVENSPRKTSTVSSTATVAATSQGWKVSHEDSSDTRQNHQKNKQNSENGEHSGSSKEHLPKDKETVGQLQRLSHRGYGAPVSSWNGTHAQLNRQVFEDKKNELKRSANSDDEMDRGRVKKVKYNHYNKYHSRNGNFNAFQESQNQINKWGGNKHYRKFNHYRRDFKHKPRNHFGFHYRNHNNYHHHPYNSNR